MMDTCEQLRTMDTWEQLCKYILPCFARHNLSADVLCTIWEQLDRTTKASLLLSSRPRRRVVRLTVHSQGKRTEYSIGGWRSDRGFGCQQHASPAFIWGQRVWQFESMHLYAPLHIFVHYDYEYIAKTVLLLKRRYRASLEGCYSIDTLRELLVHRIV